MFDHQYIDELQNALLSQYYEHKDIDYLIKDIEYKYIEAKKKEKWLNISCLFFLCVGLLVCNVVQQEISSQFWRIALSLISGIIMFAPFLFLITHNPSDEVKYLKDYYYIVTKIKYTMQDTKNALKQAKQELDFVKNAERNQGGANNDPKRE